MSHILWYPIENIKCYSKNFAGSGKGASCKAGSAVKILSTLNV